MSPIADRSNTLAMRAKPRVTIDFRQTMKDIHTIEAIAENIRIGHPQNEGLLDSPPPDPITNLETRPSP